MQPTKAPLPVSIIINNYNYGRYVGRAIESALDQSYPWCEVVVVDDGSSDNSHAVISSYGTRILPILKENGGQASALNAGFKQSHGNIILFLDADDLLYPFLVEQVVRLFQAENNIVRVQFRLDVVDATGTPVGATMPPREKSIPHGDLLQPLLHYGDDIPWLPTSGNAFSTEVLRRIMPIPEEGYRICADYYLSNLTPLFGTVASLDEVGGGYRVHGDNHHAQQQADPRHIRANILRTELTHSYLQHQAHQLGLNVSSGVAAESLTWPANRLISLRLDPSHHPLTGDSRYSLAKTGIWAALRRGDLGYLKRCMYIVWFFLTTIAPKAGVRWLAQQLLTPTTKGSGVVRSATGTLVTEGQNAPPSQSLDF